MKANKLSFESENLTIDYISFNIQGYIKSISIKKIAFYLFESFGFNSTFTKDDPTQGCQEKTIFYAVKNQHNVSFRQFDYNPQIKSFWVGTKIIFSGDNANHLYNRIKKNQLDWKIFDHINATLARIDLYYFRETKINDQNEFIEDFMEKCRQRVKVKNKRRKA